MSKEKNQTLGGWWRLYCAFGAFLTVAFIFVPGEIYSYLTVYHLSRPDPKFDERMSFQISTFFWGCYTFTQVVAFLATAPLYRLMKLRVTKARTALHCLAAAALSFGVFLTGLTVRILGLLPLRWIGNSGVEEIVVVNTLVSVGVYAAVILVHWFLSRRAAQPAFPKCPS